MSDLLDGAGGMEEMLEVDEGGSGARGRKEETTRETT